jgi:hypothetical protein
MPFLKTLTLEEKDYAQGTYYRAHSDDDTRALIYFVRSADKGYAPALQTILQDYLFTKHVYDSQTLYDNFSRPGAGPVSLAYMGMFYEDGQIVPRCEYVARDCYRKSMDAGCIIGKIMYTLLMYKKTYYNIVLRHLYEIHKFPEYIQLNSGNPTKQYLLNRENNCKYFYL